jgi:hypothetical protein
MTHKERLEDLRWSRIYTLRHWREEREYYARRPLVALSSSCRMLERQCYYS